MSRLFTAALLATAITIGLPSDHATAQEPEILRNADVVTLVRAGLGEDLILLKIRSSTCQFDTSEDAISVLRAARVPDAVLQAMAAATGPRRAPTSEPPLPPPPQRPSAREGTQFQLFHIVTGGAWHFGILTVSHDRVIWNETDIAEDNSVAQKNRGFFDPRYTQPGVSEDNFDVPCADVLSASKNKMVIGHHIRLRDRNFNLARAVPNKEGKLAPKDSDRVPGLDEAITKECPNAR